MADHLHTPLPEVVGMLNLAVAAVLRKMVRRRTSLLRPDSETKDLLSLTECSDADPIVFVELRLQES